MSDETTTESVEETTTSTVEKTTEETVPFEQYDKANKLARSAKESAKHAQQQVAELQKQLEERESAGMPELDQMKKRLEAAEKRAEENERKAVDAEAKVTRSAKERWVTTAAQAQNFADPTDASAFVDLDQLEDEKDAERAVKRLAAAKKHLLKPDEPRLPGRVLENGQPVQQGKQGGIDLGSEAQMVSDELRKYLAGRNG